MTKIHIRGNFLNQGKEVKPGVPALFPPLPPGSPPTGWRSPAGSSMRNPLTARVTVNRYWEQIFGVGLVETPEDFGIRGKPADASASCSTGWRSSSGSRTGTSRSCSG